MTATIRFIAQTASSIRARPKGQSCLFDSMFKTPQSVPYIKIGSFPFKIPVAGRYASNLVNFYGFANRSSYGFVPQHSPAQPGLCRKWMESKFFTTVPLEKGLQGYNCWKRIYSSPIPNLGPGLSVRHISQLKVSSRSFRRSPEPESLLTVARFPMFGSFLKLMGSSVQLEFSHIKGLAKLIYIGSNVTPSG